MQSLFACLPIFQPEIEFLGDLGVACSSHSDITLLLISPQRALAILVDDPCCLDLALHDLQTLFSDSGVNVQDQFITAYDVFWSCENTNGDAMFLPCHFSRLGHMAKLPGAESNVHFAGEHLRRHHTWVGGAIDSAQETVAKLLGCPDLAGPEGEYLRPKKRAHDKRTVIPR